MFTYVRFDPWHSSPAICMEWGCSSITFSDHLFLIAGGHVRWHTHTAYTPFKYLYCVLWLWLPPASGNTYQPYGPSDPLPPSPSVSAIPPFVISLHQDDEQGFHLDGQRRTSYCRTHRNLDWPFMFYCRKDALVKLCIVLCRFVPISSFLQLFVRKSWNPASVTVLCLYRCTDWPPGNRECPLWRWSRCMSSFFCFCFFFGGGGGEGRGVVAVAARGSV